MTIIPAVIPESETHLTSTLRTIATFSREAQIDVVDGVFVPSISWPYIEGVTPQVLSKFTESMDLEIDLMVQNPESVLKEYLEAGVRRVVVHLESVTDLPVIVALKRDFDFSLAFSIGNDTPISTLEAVIGYADYVQLMGIASIGSQGQPFDDRVLERIRTIVGMHFASLPISIDGSVNAETLPLLREAGADRVVVGSAILQASDPRVAYETLVALATR